MSARQPRSVDRRIINNPAVKCLTCCVAQKLKPGSVEVQDADTWVPVWRTQAVNGQMMMGLAIEPVCFEHLTVTEQTAVDRGLLADGKMPADLPTMEQINKAMRQAGLL